MLKLAVLYSADPKGRVRRRQIARRQRNLTGKRLLRREVDLIASGVERALGGLVRTSRLDAAVRRPRRCRRSSAREHD